jgi:hypothetical protein
MSFRNFSLHSSHLHPETAKGNTLLALEYDLNQTHLGNQDAIALLNTHGHASAVFAQRSRANGENFGLVKLLDTGLGQEDTAGSFSFGLDSLNEDAVQ